MVSGKLLYRHGRFSIWYYPGHPAEWEIGYRSVHFGKLWVYW